MTAFRVLVAAALMLGGASATTQAAAPAQTWIATWAAPAVARLDQPAQTAVTWFLDRHLVTGRGGNTALYRMLSSAGLAEASARVPAVWSQQASGASGASHSSGWT